MLNFRAIRCGVTYFSVSSDKVAPLPKTWQQQREKFKRTKARAPSQQGQTPEFEELQKGDLYYACGRPVEREADVPLTLLHPVFGQFVDDCRKIAPTRADYAVAFQLREKMCAFYPNEGDRRQKICETLQKYGIAIHPGPIGGTEHKTDGHVCSCNRPVLILEVKNDIGWKGAEPSLQLVLYFWIFCDEHGLADESMCHPCLVVFIAGE
jgi:hypothetical protein